MTLWLWGGFVALILTFLALDLGVFHRKAHVVRIREAFAWTSVWVVMALAFSVAVYFLYEHHWLGVGLTIGHELDGRQAAAQFLTGYIIEKSLSLDNVFVIAIIFSYFRIPAMYQHRVLFWGILGALVMRGAMIALGAALLERFSWATYAFGILLLGTAVKMLMSRHDNLEPDRSLLVRVVRRWIPVTPELHGGRFLTRVDGRLAATPLFLVLLLVEATDVVFAVDSVPAIFAVTRDPFLVFTSNVFAILGLRSLYFALAGAMTRFRFLKMSLVFVLAFVGVKMLLAHYYHFPTFVSLSVILGILAVGVAASLLGGHRDTAALAPPPLPGEEEKS
jgi:tellurite resistance protein TerC